MNWPASPVSPDIVVRAVRAMPGLSPALEARVAAHWSAACREHALFNGRVFSVDRSTEDVIEGHWTEYRRSVAQMREPALRTQLGVRNLAVCGIIETDDGILLGRRATDSIYLAGLWQLAPAGSVDFGAATPEGADVHDALMSELAEELGLTSKDVGGFQPLCLVEHPQTGVTDLGIRLRTRLTLADICAAHAALGNAEYDELIAAPPDRLGAAILARQGAMVPATASFLAALAHAG